MMQEFTLPDPISANKLRTVARGRIIDSPDYRAWKKAAQQTLVYEQRASKRKVSGPIRVHIRIPETCRADADNTFKAALDALVRAGAIDDDRNVRTTSSEYAGDVFTIRVEPIEAQP